MESKSSAESNGKIKHAETLGGEYIFQATSTYSFSKLIVTRAAVVPTFQSDRRLRGFALVAFHLSPLSSSWHSEYFATRVFNNFLFKEQL
jgi:hypothetical protein